jgi:hypothetical protein
MKLILYIYLYIYINIITAYDIYRSYRHSLSGRNEKKYYQKNAHEPGSAEPETKRKKDKKDKKDADGSEPKPEKAKKSKNDQ